VQVQVGGLWQGHVIHILTLGPLLSMERMKIVINILMVINIRCRFRSQWYKNQLVKNLYLCNANFSKVI